MAAGAVRREPAEWWPVSVAQSSGSALGAKTRQAHAVPLLGIRRAWLAGRDGRPQSLDLIGVRVGNHFHRFRIAGNCLDVDVGKLESPLGKQLAIDEQIPTVH